MNEGSRLSLSLNALGSLLFFYDLNSSLWQCSVIGVHDAGFKKKKNFKLSACLFLTPRAVLFSWLIDAMAYAKAAAPSASMCVDLFGLSSVLLALLTLASPARHLHQQVGVADARVQNIHDDFNGL